MSKTLVTSTKLTQKCPNCGNVMSALKGSMTEKCHKCGLKDGCCY